MDNIARFWRPTAFRRVSGALSILLALLASSGCMSIYPSLGKVDPTDACYTPDVTQNAGLRISKARECFAKLRYTLNNGQVSVSKFQRSAEYLALAGGGFAGARLLKSDANASTDGPVKSVALGVAVLAGFTSLADTKGTHQVLTTGLTAIQCILDAATSVQTLRQGLGNFNFNDQNSFFRFSTSRASSTQTLLESYRSNLKLDPLVSFAINQSITYSSTLTAAEARLPGELEEAYRNLFDTLQSALTSRTKDVVDIFKTQMTLVGSTLQGITEAEGAAKKAGEILDISGQAYGLPPLTLFLDLNSEAAQDVKTKCLSI